MFADLQALPITVVGLSEAGKTAIVRRLRGQPLDILLRTVGIDAELIPYGEYVVHLFDLGGSIAFQQIMWQHYIRYAKGVIFVVDGANAEDFFDAYQAFAQVISCVQAETPLLLLWNKSDLSGFVPYPEVPEEFSFDILAKQHSLPFAVGEVSALENRRIQPAFDWLMQHLHADFYQKGIHPQALRVYSRQPEIIIAELGEVEFFESILEFCAEKLQPAAIKLLYAPIQGGNYLISSFSDLFFCIAIFHHETPRNFAQKYAQTALRIVESSIREHAAPFPLTSTKMPASDYLTNNSIREGLLLPLRSGIANVAQ
jgi:ADP-ribosylation factor-like protein 2